MMITRTGIVNDLHIPYHDKTAVDLVLNAFDSIKIDRLIINGDLLDFYNIHMHGPKSPTVQEDLLEEIMQGQAFLSDLRKKFPKIEIIYLFGNHENRLDRFILKNAKAFWNILRLEKMLDLKRFNIDYHLYNSCVRLEETDLYIQHSPPSYSVNGARASLLKKHDASFIYACTHRKQSAFITGHSGNEYSVYFNGWLGDSKNNKEIFGYTKGHEEWQKCASVVTTINREEFFVNQLEIKNNKLVLDGSLYEI